MRSSGLVLGMALQFLQVLWQPAHAQVVVAQREEAAEDEDDGDPEGRRAQLARQLRRIRQGNRLENLTLRL